MADYRYVKQNTLRSEYHSLRHSNWTSSTVRLEYNFLQKYDGRKSAEVMWQRIGARWERRGCKHHNDLSGSKKSRECFD